MFPWSAAAPNHGFMLKVERRIVGAYVAYYSSRSMSGNVERFCNLGAWCVVEEFRPQGIKLLRSLLSQDGYHFTDLSPSGNVIALNRKLKFKDLDTRTAILLNLPWLTRATPVRVSSNPKEIVRSLSGQPLQVYRDHMFAPAAKHVVLIVGTECCYVMLRRDSRKNLRLFGSILYVSHPALFDEFARSLGGHLLWHYGIPVTLIEQQVIGRLPRAAVASRPGRPKMFKSASLNRDDIDYLYSELACLQW